MTAIANLLDALTNSAIKVVDLTQPLSPETPVLTLPPEFGQCAAFSQREVSRYDERGVAWYWNEFTMNEHTGTHFDAPVHWISGRDLPASSVDTIDPQGFVGPACVIDVCAEAAANPDFILEDTHITAWEDEHGQLPAGAYVLMRTDWSKRPVADYVNRREDGAHTPGPSAAAIRLLVARDVRGFGVETIGTDAGQAHGFDPPYPAHHLLHQAGKYGLQCLANLDQLPATGAVLMAAPLKIVGGSGSPLRVIALVEA